MMDKILLIGPKINVSNKKSYGGGSGGYTRNMYVYLNYFLFDTIKVIPVFHTIKGEINFGIFTKPYRLLLDIIYLVSAILKNKIQGVHILGQYRGAVLREFCIVLICKILQIPILYEIKAGAFIKSYESGNSLYKKSIDIIIKNSKIILVEGKIYQEHIYRLYHKKSYYFPNIVPTDEIPNKVDKKFQSGILKVLFVGFAYEGKGIKELIMGCDILAKKGKQIELTLVGLIDPEIENFIDNMYKSKLFKINKKGKLKHSDVLSEFTTNDIYAYPTKHEGEGHNNTINEALMHQMVISSTKIGFIDDFLNDENSYPINELNSEVISNTFLKIIRDIPLAIDKSRKGRKLILEQFNSEIAKLNLEKYYNELLR